MLRIGLLFLIGIHSLMTLAQPQATVYGSSTNLYTSYLSESSVISVDAASEFVLAVHRGGGLLGATGDDIVFSYTVDSLHFSSYVFTPPTGRKCRFPNVALYNPLGNSDITKAYAIFTTPVTNGTDWVGSYMGSVRLDGANLDTLYLPLDSVLYMFTSQFAIDPLARIHCSGTAYKPSNDSLRWHGGIVKSGIFVDSLARVIWQEVNLIQPSFYPVSSAETEPAVFSSGSAWSPDGNTGYFFFLGKDKRNPYHAPQPLVYKSTTLGESWQQLPYMDFSQQDSLSAYLFPTDDNPSLVVPYFHEIDPVVDANGQLHLLSAVSSKAYSLYEETTEDMVIHAQNFGLLFDVYMTADSLWEAQPIAQLLTDDVSENDPVFPQVSQPDKNVSWNHRLQAARTYDGNHLFFTWSDTYPVEEFGIYINMMPNVFAYGKSIADSSQTEISLLTDFDPAFSGAYFYHIPDVVFDSDDFYMIPITYVDMSNVTDDDDYVVHQYIVGAGFSKAEFVVNPGVYEYAHPQASIHLFPNPAKDIVTIHIAGEELDAPTVELISMSGERVLMSPIWEWENGVNRLSVNLSSISSGIYIVVVTPLQGNPILTKISKQ